MWTRILNCTPQLVLGYIVDLKVESPNFWDSIVQPLLLLWLLVKYISWLKASAHTPLQVLNARMTGESLFTNLIMTAMSGTHCSPCQAPTLCTLRLMGGWGKGGVTSIVLPQDSTGSSFITIRKSQSKIVERSMDIFKSILQLWLDAIEINRQTKCIMIFLINCPTLDLFALMEVSMLLQWNKSLQRKSLEGFCSHNIIL